ncbi:MAG: hypothetical protein O7B99_07075 [Planctomycetota bacterium]|nr:hypothetical protein [Planctomycetota bacterium]
MSAGAAIKIGGAAAVSLAVLVGLGRLAGFDLGLFRGPVEGIQGAKVKRGPLRINVIERANLKAANSTVLKSELERRTTILWLIEEGEWVQPGDLLVELDAAEFVEQHVAQEIAVQNAEAANVKADQQLQIQVSQNESDIAMAVQDLEFARDDLIKFREADRIQEEQKAKEDITLAEEDLERKKDELEWSKKLLDQGFLTRTKYEADQLARNSAVILLDQRERALKLLIKYEFPRRKKEYEAAIEEKVRELDRVRLQAKARIVDYEANLASTEARWKLETDELVKLDDQIAKAKIFAPAAGMVVYARERRGRYGDSDPIQEGTEVHERQDIITIPSSEGMIAEMALHESVVEKVLEGMPCVIHVDALPGRIFTGRVKFKAVLPDQNSWWANPDLRVYRADVEILENLEGLNSGMSCSVEIVVKDIPDALHIPVQSVFLDKGNTVALVSDGGVEVRPIEVGLDNGKWVEVLSGLEEGEVVLMSQPASITLEPAIEEQVPVEAFDPLEMMRRRTNEQRGQPGERGGFPGSAARGEGGERPSFGDERSGRPTSGEEPRGRQASGKRPGRSGGGAPPAQGGAEGSADSEGQ